MDNATYKAAKVAEAQAAVDAALRKVEKAKVDVTRAKESVEVARAELAEVEATDYVWEEPQEHVIARVG